MSKLFVAVVPNSECENHVKRAVRAFEDVCPCEKQDYSKDRDAIYYMLDETYKHPGLAEIIYDNLVNGKYSQLGFIIRHDDLIKSMYGLYRAEVKSEDFTMDDFIKGGKENE